MSQIGVSYSNTGAVIKPGDLVPSELDGTNFTSVHATESTQRTFIISNNGTGSLTGLSATTTRDSAFSILAQPPSALAPGQWAAVVVLFSPPAGTKAYSATVVVHSNDPTNPAYSFAVWGFGFEYQ